MLILHFHHIKRYNFAVKSLLDFFVVISKQPTMQVFHLPGDNAVSGGRIRYKLTAESGS